MYYLVVGWLYLFSLLPLRVLYLFSDLAYFLLYHVIGYRKKVVLQNLTIAFPRKTEKEKETIARQFYKNLCDTFIESIKFISASKAFIMRRFTGDYSVVDALYDTGRSVQIHLGHNFNWELANFAVPLSIRFKTLVVYLPLHSKVFNRLFLYIRSRFGSHLIAATNMKEEMQPYWGTQYLFALIADQSPANPKNAYWVNFFGRPTAFLRGPEKSARRNNWPVVFSHFIKQKRGLYKGFAHLATLHPRELPEGELTKLYVHYLEKVMTANPEMWLWSHRRWKHEWKEEYGPVLE
ncbi:MAG: lysophospholipid acyltransferase family protein [Flavisolibacter sp.]|nr:lysophospholipid acyltransferase family protein [Flavisolibacter sp.]